MLYYNQIRERTQALDSSEELPEADAFKWDAESLRNRALSGTTMVRPLFHFPAGRQRNMTSKRWDAAACDRRDLYAFRPVSYFLTIGGTNHES